MPAAGPDIATSSASGCCSADPANMTAFLPMLLLLEKGVLLLVKLLGC
jgi:hypothetical protein